MPSQFDEKKRAMVAMLDCLRIYNPRIGSYDKSVYTEDFDYSVKLSNGRIRIPEEIIQDFEKSPLLIKEDVYGTLAKRFIANELPNEPKPILQNIATAQVPQQEDKKSISNRWKVIAITTLVLAIGAYWYSNTQQEQERVIAREVAEREHQSIVARDSAQKKQERVKKESERAAARVNIYDQVSEEASSYMANQLFGGISGLKITVTNNSDYTVDMVKVKVSYIKSSGGLYKDEYVYFNKISPHSSLTEPAPDSNRGTSTTIERVSLTCSELGLY